MNDKNNFYSQFKSFKEPVIQWTACGICSIAMVLDSLKKFENYKNNEKDLENFAISLINKHINGSLPVKVRNLKLNEKYIEVTIGLCSKYESLPFQRDINPNDTKYLPVYKINSDKTSLGKQENFFPVFTLIDGYYHSASKCIFKQFGISADIEEGYSFSSLLMDYKNKQFEYFLPSIHSLRGRGSHVVVLNKISSDSKRNYVEIVDPGELEYEYALKRFDLDYFESIYNGYGTQVR